jgi:hypothetical protein
MLQARDTSMFIGAISTGAIHSVGFTGRFRSASTGTWAACCGLPGEPCHMRFSRKKPAVTWCYNPSGGITFFASTRWMGAHKLLLTSHWEVGTRGVATAARPSLKTGFAIARKANLRRVVEQVKDRERRVFEKVARVAGRADRAPGVVRLCETVTACTCRHVAWRNTWWGILPAGPAECTGRRSLVRFAAGYACRPG